VVIAGEDGRAHRRAVRVGLALRDRVELASGVTAGERVLVSGFDLVSEGTARSASSVDTNASPNQAIPKWCPSMKPAARLMR
jgi:hypothetical protein